MKAGPNMFSFKKDTLASHRENNVAQTVNKGE